MSRNRLSKKRLTLIAALAVLMVLSVAVLLMTACSNNENKFNFQNVTYLGNEAGYITPSDVVVDGDFAYVSDWEKKCVYKVSVSTRSVVATKQFEQYVSSVYVADSNVYAMMGELDGNVVKMDKELNVLATGEAGHTPVDMQLADSFLYVVNRFSNSVGVYNKETLSLTTTITIKASQGREPMKIKYVGGKLYVVCQLPSGAANANHVAANLVIIDPATNRVEHSQTLLNGTASVKDLAASSDGKYLYITNIFSRYAYPTSQLDRGWINTNGITVYDIESNEVLCGVLIDDVDLGAANPWGITVLENGYIAIAASGTDEMIFLSERELMRRIVEVAEGKNEVIESVDKIVDYADFLDEAKVRYKMSGKGVRNLYSVENDVYVCQYFTGNVIRLTVEENVVDNTLSISKKTLSLGTQGAFNAVKKGEIMWFDATECYQQWESCNSCHPDARVDGFNWDNMNDGIGNPKTTKSMIYSHRTPPVMITAARPSAEIAVEKGMLYIQFNTVPKEELMNIDEYLKSLKPTTSPYRNRDGSLTESATRGKQLFSDFSCTTCHSGPNYTDMKTHDVSKEFEEGDGWDVKRPFDTPTLVEVWRSGPWLFNGKAATMEEAVRYNVKGLAVQPTAQQITDLANYVLSIDDSDEIYGVEQVLFDVPKQVDKTVNLLYGGSKMSEIYIRKQANVDAKALVTIELFDGNGKLLKAAMHAKIDNIKMGDRAVIHVDLDIPRSVDTSCYYRITIQNYDKQNEYLATEFKVYARNSN